MAESIAVLKRRMDAQLETLRRMRAERWRFYVEQLQAEDQRRLARNQRSRAFWRVPGRVMPAHVREAWLVEVAEAGAPHANDPDVRQLRTWIERVCRTERIEVVTIHLPTVQQASAWARLRVVGLPPLQSRATCARAAHEIGHVLAPPPPSAVRISRPDGSLCVAGEILAWRWAVRHAPVWTTDMHIELAGGLTSYRPYASADEAAEIDRFISPAGYRLARLERHQR